MRTVSMDIDVEYLLHFLEDELRDYPDIRLHPVAPSTTQKAVDMPQDYDPEVGQVHLNRGVRIRVGSREFFFPATWVKQARFDEIKALAEEVRTYLTARLG